MNKTIEIPVISNNARIWMIRTQSGKYYYDFVRNNYVALGWDKIDAEYLDSLQTKDEKNTYIEEMYPDEKRPGLILSQIETFTKKISIGDYILIPSKGGGSVCLGIATGKIDKINRFSESEEYEKCEYKLKISVEWIKEIYTWQDVYLFKILRAVQTISDITKYADLILRNSYDVYATDSKLHLMLKKATTSPCMLKNRMEFDSSIYSVIEKADEMFDESTANIEYKTAIGSPGFIEIILPYSASTLFAISVFVYVLRTKNNKDGVSVSGISAIIKSISDLFNDKTNRDLTRAQTKKLLVETESIELDNEIKKIQIKEMKENGSKIIIANDDDLKLIADNAKKLETAANNMGISPISIGEKAS